MCGTCGNNNCKACGPFTIPEGLPGIQGDTGATGPAGANGTDGIDGLNGRALISVSLYDFNGGLPQMIVGGTGMFVPVARFIFPGVTSLGTPSNIYANIWGTNVKNKNILIRDITNSVDVAKKLNIIVAAVPANISQLTDISFNFPLNPAVLEIQVSAEAGESVKISSVTIY